MHGPRRNQRKANGVAQRKWFEIIMARPEKNSLPKFFTFGR
jgi:hypothetical protein